MYFGFWSPRGRRRKLMWFETKSERVREREGETNDKSLFTGFKGCKRKQDLVAEII